MRDLEYRIFFVFSKAPDDQLQGQQTLHSYVNPNLRQDFGAPTLLLSDNQKKEFMQLCSCSTDVSMKFAFFINGIMQQLLAL